MKNAQGAVMTNAATAAYAIGDIPDLQAAFETNLKEDKSFVPDPKRAAYYRKIYERKTKLVREEMRAAFVALEEIRQVEK